MAAGEPKNGILLSICIPTYNRKNYLERCLRKIEECSVGSENEIQICVSDNASSDGTYEILKKMAAKSRVSILINRNERNLGFDGNIMTVIDMAQGEWIWLCGDDDYLYSPNFPKMLEFLRDCRDKDVFIIQTDSVYENKLADFFNQANDGKAFFQDTAGIIKQTPTFLAELTLRNSWIKNLTKNERKHLLEGMGSEVIHSWLIKMICLEHPDAKYLKYPITTMVTRVSSTHISNPQKQIRSMAHFVMLPLLSLKLAIRTKWGYLPSFAITTVSMYARFAFNIVIARNFRDIRYDNETVTDFYTEFRWLSVFFIGPYFMITFAPRLFSKIIYSIGTRIALATGFEKPVGYKLSVERWSNTEDKSGGAK